MSKVVYGYVYKITNLINNKVYIGQTTQSLNKRFNSHKHKSKTDSPNQYIHRAIKKYGFKNFVIEVIDVGYSREELNILEESYIKNNNSIVPNGYNLTSYTKGQQLMSEETKEKIKIQSNKPHRLKMSSENGKRTRGSTFTEKYIGVFKSGNNWQSSISINDKRIYRDI